MQDTTWRYSIYRKRKNEFHPSPRVPPALERYSILTILIIKKSDDPLRVHHVFMFTLFILIGMYYFISTSSFSQVKCFICKFVQIMKGYCILWECAYTTGDGNI